MLIYPLVNDLSRKIIHIDMDAFFASVEERDNPRLKGKPVVIGSDPRQTGGRGVVATANYEARKYGIHSAMSSKEAYELCPTAIFISGNHEKYRAVAKQIRSIFKRYTAIFEPVSIDEAYLDVTENKLGISSAIKIAKLIQYDIWKELKLTCSAGVSYNKFLAKLASDYQKPKGLTVILPEDAIAFLADLPIEKFHGVGVKSVEQLQKMGIKKGSDLLAYSEQELIDTFGRFGYELFRKARGISNSPVRTDRIRKSIGKEKTYAKRLYTEEDIQAELTKLVVRVVKILEEMNRYGKTIILKIRYSDFETKTKRRSLEEATQDKDIIEQEVYQLFESLPENKTGVRLLGVTVSGFEDISHDILLDL
ncbi:DNA polymerase IV [Streptococcus zalophi]|uniref:DNA polymerase IV n=1 Tax=Streptococcus zalophi TaxID=640031 RepID=A0A934PAW4_9STRE|nr:DNA polymerase IV [Streptococcus zalophi]MBJ8350045.1 DNA polymerase IV [Streptococcus zalophi]MCR8967051.1 DNA polymerase IV [Streptococcus zalophi]